MPESSELFIKPINHIELRPKSQSDTEVIHDIYNRAYRDVVVRQFGSWNQDGQDGYFLDSWDRRGARVIICDNEICGYFVTEDIPEGIFVYEIVISPDFQGRGIGSKLLKETQDIASILQDPTSTTLLGRL